MLERDQIMQVSSVEAMRWTNVVMHLGIILIMANGNDVLSITEDSGRLNACTNRHKWQVITVNMI